MLPAATEHIIDNPGGLPLEHPNKEQATRDRRKQSMADKNEDLWVRYLLGDLPDEDQERLSEQYFEDDGAWETLNAIESDLIDHYVRGDLPPVLRQKFEARFMNSPRRRERVEFAEMLMNSDLREQGGATQTRALLWPNSRKPPSNFLSLPHRAALGISAALALFMAITTAIVAIQNRQLRAELKKTQDAEAALRTKIDQQQSLPHPPAQDASNPATLVLPSSEIPTISIMLSAGSVRNGKDDRPRLPLPGVRSLIVLLLDLEEDQYAAYDAVIKTADGKLIDHLTGLKSQPIQNGGRGVPVRIPSQVLKTNDYVLTLSGATDNGGTAQVGSYIFSTSR